MKYAKMLGMLAVAAAVLMAFAGTASATVLTDENGNVLGVGTKIHANNIGNTVLDGTVNITCKKSTVIGEVTNAGGASSTVSGHISTLTFEECGNNTVTVVNKGTLEVHTDSATADSNGTLTSSGAEVTVLTHNILGTVHCIYVTENTDVGTVDGSKHKIATGFAPTPTITTDSVPIPRKSTDFGCGSTSEWTAKYEVVSPMYLDVD